MKIDQEDYLIETGEFPTSKEYLSSLEEVRLSVRGTTWHSESEFIINPTIHGNGVKPIKDYCIKFLAAQGWKTEVRYKLVDGIAPGGIDAIKETEKGILAVEWETGNISSSHRALNKLALGLIQGHIVGGILIVPNKLMYRYLTDRVGNHTELLPYLPLYRTIAVSNGVLMIMTIEHDGTSNEAPFIPKGSDGNAKKVEW